MENSITLTHYNRWANQSIADWLLSNDSEKMEIECASSFPTIAQTINHIWDAEIFYLSILKQIPLHKSSDKSAQSAIQGFVVQSEAFAHYVSQLDAVQLNEPRTVQIKAISGTFSQHQLIQHCMNHSTFHRGQIITMGHQLNLSKAPSTDLFYYYYLNGIEKTF